MKKMQIEERKLAQNEDDGPGQIVVGAQANLPPIVVRGQDHDYVSVFCDGAWLHFPVRYQ